MKFVITGSLGNISKPLAQTLIAAGHSVTVISSNADKVKDIEAIGASPAIGTIDDVDFLTRTFTGADAIYTMVPPSFTTTDNRKYYNETAENYAAAIKASGVKRVVQLSSIGAHLPDGTGPIKGLYDLEGIFNTMDDVNIVFLRPSYFYTNYYGNADMIKHAGILGANYPADATMIMVHPADIAAAAAEEMQTAFTGKEVRYVTSDEMSLSEVTALLGKAAGKPELPWVEFSDEEALAGMVQAGLSQEFAANYTEMGKAIKSGILYEDYYRNKPVLSGRKFSAFAEEFGRLF